VNLLQQVRQQLQAVQHELQPPRLVVAYSGGLDSRVLLELTLRLRAELGFSLAVLHVNHGLSPQADAWQQHCQTVAAAAGVTFMARSVQLQPGGSVELRAREARYAVFQEQLGQNEVLLQAHHQNDQAETILFRLLRGHGVEGLSGIPSRRPLGQGVILRPLLDVSRAQLETLARQWQLSWVEDGSNQCLDHDRNYLRQVILPQLTERFPAVVERIGQTGKWMLQAQQVIADWTDSQLALHSCHDGVASLQLHALASLAVDRQLLLLRAWLQRYHLTPGEQWLQDLHRQFFLSAADACPVAELGGRQLRLYRGVLYLLDAGDEASGNPCIDPSGSSSGSPCVDPTGSSSDNPCGAPPVDLPWSGEEPLTLPDGRVIALPAGFSPAEGPFRVAFRQGGEKLVDRRSGRHRDLKKVFQELGVPPWQRGRIPLLFRSDQLLAVMVE
jgi:tRNA(Ile)-lysidine synthase